MPNLAEPPAPGDPVAHHGFVVDPPAKLGDPFTVRVPGFDELHVFEIRRWEYRGSTLPAVDDECLVIIDDEAEPWVPAWWPAGGDPGSASTEVVQITLELFGPEPRAVEALIGDASVHSYGFPGSALTASTQTLLHHVTGEVLYALWDIAWNVKGNEETGIRLVGFEGGPINIEQLAEHTGASVKAEGKSLTLPVHCQSVITAAVAEFWEAGKLEGEGRFLGHQLKTGPFPAEAPIVFMSRVHIALRIVTGSGPIADPSESIGMIIHGSDPATARGSIFGHYIWVGSVAPENASENDLLVKTK